MNDSKLPHMIFGTIAAIWFKWLSWANTNVATLAGWASVLASVVTICVGIVQLFKWWRNRGKAG